MWHDLRKAADSPKESLLPSLAGWFRKLQAEEMPAFPARLPVCIEVLETGRDDLLRCLELVIAHPGARDRLQVFLIADGLGEPESLREILAPRVVECPVPLWFSEARPSRQRADLLSALRRIELPALFVSRHAVLTRRWLERFLASEGQDPGTWSSLSPLSRTGGIFSAPKKTITPLPYGITEDVFTRIIACVGAGQTCTVPLPNPASTIFSAPTIAAAAESWPAKPEVNSQGLAAQIVSMALANEAGDSGTAPHLLDCSCFVLRGAESGGASGSAELADLLGEIKSSAAGAAALQEHRDWLLRDPIRPFRNRIGDALKFQPLPAADEAGLVAGVAGAPVLHVIHEGIGGANQTAVDLVNHLAADRDNYLLQTGSRSWRLYHRTDAGFDPILAFPLETPWAPGAALDDQRLSAWSAVLERVCPSVVHVRHLIGNGPEILQLTHDAGLRLVFSFHDYYTLCPSIGLRDPDSGRLCSGDCSFKSPLGGVALPPALQHENSSRKHEHWRAHFSAALSQADAFVVASTESARRLRVAFPFVDEAHCRIIPHGRDLRGYRPVAREPEWGKGAIRVLSFGILSEMKGSALLAELMRLNAAAGGPFEFHFAGRLEEGLDPEAGGGFFHGEYRRDSLPGLVEEIRPALALLPSLWPETFFHALSEAWALGLPVVTTNLGSQQSRTLESGAGWCFDPGDPAGFFDGMRRNCADPEEYRVKAAAVRNYRHKSADAMAREYLKLYGVLDSSG